METEEILSSASETVEYAKIYVEQQVSYFQLEASKRLAKTTSNLVTLAIISFLTFMVILFLSIAIAFLIGSYWGSYGLAFLLLTGIYALAAILIFFFKRQIVTDPLTTMIIKNMLD